MSHWFRYFLWSLQSSISGHLWALDICVDERCKTIILWLPQDDLLCGWLKGFVSNLWFSSSLYNNFFTCWCAFYSPCFLIDQTWLSSFLILFTRILKRFENFWSLVEVPAKFRMHAFDHVLYDHWVNSVWDTIRLCISLHTHALLYQ